MLGFDIKSLMQLVDEQKYETALEKCEQFVSYCLTAFMDELTVETATNFAAATHLYAQICAMMKKPWLAVPKLESCRGALRFMKDYMTDTETLCDTCLAFAQSYAYARFYPEAVSYYELVANFSEEKPTVKEALKQCYFYQELFGKKIISDETVFEDKLSSDEIDEVVSLAKEEAKEQILNDPVENTDEFLLIRFDVEAKVDEAIRMSKNNSMPFCQLYWTEKQRILNDEFGIQWQTPAQMNPNIRFY